MTNQKPTLAKRLLPVGVLVLGAAVLFLLVRTRPDARKGSVEVNGILARVHVVSVGDVQIEVPAEGTVASARPLALQPEVSGRVVWINDRFVPGGRFRSGEAMLKIDPRDYEARLAQQEAAAERARLELELEVSRSAVAKQEWELFDENVAGTERGGLALRKPQLRAAKAAGAAAEAALEQAKVDLSRTVIYAPFNLMVQEERVEVGQLVSPQTRIAELAGTDAYWVRASLPVEKLSFFERPTRTGGEGAKVRVMHDTGRGVVEYDGRVFELLGHVDPVGSLARVLIQIENPLDDAGAAQPLLIGSYVRARIEGHTLRAVADLPRTGLREGDQVWMATTDDTLEIRKVRVDWREPDRVLIGEGLAEGDRVIVSPVAAPLPGMKIRVEQPQASEKPAEKPSGDVHAQLEDEEQKG